MSKLGSLYLNILFTCEGGVLKTTNSDPLEIQKIVPSICSYHIFWIVDQRTQPT